MPSKPTSPPTHPVTQATGASARAFAWVVLAYCVALAAAVAVLLQNAIPLSENILIRALIADVVATCVIFGFSTAFANASFYDAYWSVAPPILLVYFLAAQRAEAESLWDVRSAVIALLVLAWAIRLTHNWARGWQGLTHADWRYVDLAQKTKPFWWLVNFLGIHLMPTLLVFVGCVALQLSLSVETQPFNSLDMLATLVGFSALWLETTADNQLRNFRLNHENAGKTLASGVWAWCRHPNYLGELGFWFALYIYAYAAVGEASFELAIWGPIAMLVLFVGISIPMIDKRLANRDGFAAHKKQTFALLPISHLVRRAP